MHLSSNEEGAKASLPQTLRKPRYHFHRCSVCLYLNSYLTHYFTNPLQARPLKAAAVNSHYLARLLEVEVAARHRRRPRVEQV